MLEIVKTEIIEKYDVSVGANVTFDNLVFERGVISKLIFIKQTFENGSDILLIEFYIGNIRIIKFETNEDYDIATEEGDSTSYWINRSNEI